MPVPCACCSMPLPKWELPTGDAANCPSCGSRNTVRLFPAALAQTQASRAETALEGEGACFDHPAKRAVAACQQCGRFVCQLCAVQFGSGVWCPSCVAASSGKARQANSDTSRTLYDTWALATPFALLLVWPLTVAFRARRGGAGHHEMEAAHQPGAPQSLAIRRGPGRGVGARRGLALAHLVPGGQGQVEGVSMEPNRERYRKLPGRRRGFIFGSSVWMGSDHLLLVKSARFREEYKRFYFRDIQAIVTANAPRFHISTRAALIWMPVVDSRDRQSSGRWPRWAPCGFSGVGRRPGHLSGCTSPPPAVAAAASTPPSAPRSFPRYIAPGRRGAFWRKWSPPWRRRRALSRAIGRRRWKTGRSGRRPRAESGSPCPARLRRPRLLRLRQTARTPVSFLFVAILCLGGLADLLTYRASATAGHWILLGFLLPQFAAAVAVMVQNYQGRLRPAMRNLAIVFLASVGVWYYAVQMAMGAAIGFQNAASHDSKMIQAQMDPMMVANSR